MVLIFWCFGNQGGFAFVLKKKRRKLHFEKKNGKGFGVFKSRGNLLILWWEPGKECLRRHGIFTSEEGMISQPEGTHHMPLAGLGCCGGQNKEFWLKSLNVGELQKVFFSSSFFEMSTANWHFPRALPVTEQQGSLPSASAEIEPCTPAAADLKHLEGVQGGEWGTLCSREPGGTGFYTVGYFQEQILWFQSLPSSI